MFVDQVLNTLVSLTVYQSGKHMPNAARAACTSCPCLSGIKSLPSTLVSIERQSARMSKITNDGLIWCDAGCFIAVPIWQQWASNG